MNDLFTEALALSAAQPKEVQRTQLRLDVQDAELSAFAEHVAESFPWLGVRPVPIKNADISLSSKDPAHKGQVTVYRVKPDGYRTVVLTGSCMSLAWPLPESA